MSSGRRTRRYNACLLINRDSAPHFSRSHVPSADLRSSFDPGPASGQRVRFLSDTTTVSTPSAFTALGLNETLVAHVTDAGYTEPTPIQAAAIPAILAGRDVIGLAATGTGKTAAFGLPLLHRLAAAPDRARPSALVLVPTRELAIQVAKAVGEYGAPLKIKTTAVYGGSGYADQIRALRNNCDIVIATPGRALDHLKRGTMDLTGIRTVILDEADEMLDMGFADDLDAILTATPATRQTLLFSATMPPRIAQIAQKHLRNPERIEIARPKTAAGEAPKVRERVVMVRRELKPLALARVLSHEGATSALVFVRTRADADGLADDLLNAGFRTESIHGGLTQEQRDRVMQKFRSGAVPVLVATDVAARGLDIDHLSHVVNFNVPESPDTYTHRIGRVGRAGREGVAITLADPREKYLLQAVERMIGRRLIPANVPTKAEIRAKRLDRTRDTIAEMMIAGGLEEFKKTLEPLLTGGEPLDVAAAVLAVLAKATHPVDAAPDILPIAGPNGPNGPNRPPHSPHAPRQRIVGSKPEHRRPEGNGPRGAMVRLWIGVGKQAGVGRRELLNALQDELGLSGRDLGSIDILDRHSTVDVPGELAEYAVTTLNNMRWNGKSVPARLDAAAAPAGRR